MINLKRAIVPGVAGVTIGALLIGAFSTRLGTSDTALAAPGAVTAAATASRSTSATLVNTGTAEATVVVKFFDQSSGAQVSNYEPTTSLKVGAPFTLDQRASGIPLTDGFGGSATGESSQKLAGVVNEFTADGGFDTYSAVPSDKVGTSASCPVVLKGFANYNTIIHVQNAGSSAGTFSVNLYPHPSGSAIPVATNTSVNPGASKSVVLETNGSVPAGFVGTAVITADVNVAVAAEQYGPSRLIDFTCPNAGATDVSVPLVFSIDNVVGTSMTIMNMGSSDTTVTLNFVHESDPSRNHTEQATIGANQNAFFDQRVSSSLGSNWIGKARVTSSGAPIAVLVQQYFAPDGVAGASFTALPTSSLSRTNYLPILFSNVNVGATNGATGGTSFFVENPNSSTVTCTFTYTPDAYLQTQGQTVKTFTDTILANKSTGYEQRVGAGSPIFSAAPTGSDARGQTNYGAPTFGAVAASCDQPVNILVNQQLNPGLSYEQLKDAFAAYNGLPGS